MVLNDSGLIAHDHGVWGGEVTEVEHGATWLQVAKKVQNEFSHSSQADQQRTATQSVTL